MRTIISVEDMKSQRGEWTDGSESVAFVPTMGALHEGHMSLVSKAKELAQRVVVSVFVNPIQFGPTEDFAKYPRTLADDIHKLESAGVDVVFAPNAAQMYPQEFQTYLTNTQMSSVLCGVSRPKHFDGVLTVVLKLLNTVRPNFAVFGKKDYQQLKIIQRMVQDLCVDTQIVAVETLRESDGLAMSSRNRYLSPKSREVAAQIYKALSLIQNSYSEGERSTSNLTQVFNQYIEQWKDLKTEYIEILNSTNLKSIETIDEQEQVVALCAVKLDGVRLIDNIELKVKMMEET